ncbi:MAG: DUF1963 domain-containing protein [Phycisphaerales bacterium]|nr:DUF1963 domain-containing protein [Phycisphaerales bacterium]
MIIRKSSKVHAEHDLDAAGKLFARAVADKGLSGELITSPYDLYSVETLRERHNLRIGEAFSTDVFVFGKGEPDTPSCTKVGGRPFWPSDREWPTSPDGSPCYFLAQFNFADSIDIVGPGLPGMVLLLLTDSEEGWLWGAERMYFHWMPGDITPANDLDVPSAIGSSGPFYGVIHRSADYPAAEDAAFELKVPGRYDLDILNGTKIGGLPHFIQSGIDTDARFLCQLGSIQAHPGVPFPWVNQREPLGLESSPGIYSDDNCAIFGDMGSIYLFIDDEGKVSWHFECY